MRTGIMSLVATGLTGALLLGLGAAPASSPAYAATPELGSGPAAGGTDVTLQLPISTVQVSITYDFGLAVDEKGTVWAWGENGYGQLGVNGTTDVTTGPRRVVANNFQQVAAGYDHSLALHKDGTLWAWGRNASGQLGVNGTSNVTNGPRLITATGSRKFIQIAAGTTCSFAIAEDGTLWAWGSNIGGKLGVNGTSNVTNGPRQITTTGSRKFVQVSAGQTHTLALAEDGTVWAWGANNQGALGVNGTTNVTTGPMQITATGSRKFAQVAAGAGYSLALDEDGRLWGWGGNTQGRLGVNGTTNVTDGPMQITATGSRKFLQVSAGTFSSFAVAEDGTLWAWGGSGGYAGLSVAQTDTPMQITSTGSRKFQQIRTAIGYITTLAIDEDGAVWGWGINVTGSAGVNGTNGIGDGPMKHIQPAVSIDSVTFGGTAAPVASLTAGAKHGQWNVKTPAHAPGLVDVVVNWKLGGVAQTPLTYTGGFQYLSSVSAEVTVRAFRDAARTIEVPPGGVVAPGRTLYLQYTVKNTGGVPVSISELKRNGAPLDPAALCPTRELGVGESTNCTQTVQVLI